MAKLAVKSKHQKDMCHNEIGLCAQGMDIILVQCLKNNGRAYVIA